MKVCTCMLGGTDNFNLCLIDIQNNDNLFGHVLMWQFKFRIIL